MRLHSDILLALVLFASASLGLPGSAVADDADEILDYLIAEREHEFLNGSVSARAKAEAEWGKIFQSQKGYRVDEVVRAEEQGALEFRTTYYPESEGPTFHVRLIQALVDTEKKLVDTKEVEALKKLYLTSKADHGTLVNGFPTAFIEANYPRGKGVIMIINENTFLIVKANTYLPLEELTRFVGSFSFANLGTFISAG